MCGDPQGTYSKIAANLKQLLQIKKNKTYNCFSKSKDAKYAGKLKKSFFWSRPEDSSARWAPTFPVLVLKTDLPFNSDV